MSLKLQEEGQWWRIGSTALIVSKYSSKLNFRILNWFIKDAQPLKRRTRLSVCSSCWWSRCQGFSARSWLWLGLTTIIKSLSLEPIIYIFLYFCILASSTSYNADNKTINLNCIPGALSIKIREIFDWFQTEFQVLRTRSCLLSWISSYCKYDSMQTE